MMYCPRDLEQLIQQHIASETDAILLISGARQTGKTTLMENVPLGKQKIIINLRDESRETVALRNAQTLVELERYLKAFYRFEPDGRTVLVIDEAQAASHLALFLMEMHRTWRGQKVVLLGSILSNLFSNNVPMPTGRTVELVCRPLNFREFLRFEDKVDLLTLLPDEIPKLTDFERPVHDLLMAEYERFLQIGGLPGIVQAALRQDDVRLLFDSYIANLYRDADRFIAQIDVERRGRTPAYGSVLEHALKSIAQKIGQPTQNSSILSTDSPAYRTVLPVVLEALKSWRLAYFLDTETKQLTSKKGYGSKKYLFDTGVVNYLINRLFPVRLSEGKEVVAKLLENCVLQDLSSYVSSTRRITCFKTNNKVQSELDFVVDFNNRLVPLEVKSTDKVNSKSIAQLLSFMKISGVKEGFVVYTGAYQMKKIEDCVVHFIPPYVLEMTRR
jgi:predicted AAA+ superfamily ATPase